MDAHSTERYSLEIISAGGPAGPFHWAIRDRGKLLQRSDRAQPTADKARAKGEAELERLRFGGWDRR